MFDVHPPEASIHGWRDFFVHLATISIGLLIALGLESCVEWVHHQHLLHQAESSLLAEIRVNAASMPARLEALQGQQATMKQDVAVLKAAIASPNAPTHGTIDIHFNISSFENVSWSTAQATGALAYMPYAAAREYSDIYAQQADIDAQIQSVLRDLAVSFGPLLNLDAQQALPEPEEAKAMKSHIETLQGQLYLLDSLLHSMDEAYRKFLATHPQHMS